MSLWLCVLNLKCMALSDHCECTKVPGCKMWFAIVSNVPYWTIFIERRATGGH